MMFTKTATKPQTGPSTTPRVDAPTKPRAKAFTNTRALALAGVATLALLVFSLFVGVYDITGAEDGWDMFFITRVPRTLSLALCGAAMAMSGVVMQMLTRNKFVEPGTTGTTDWAGLGLIISMAAFPHLSLVGRMAFAIASSFIGTMVFFAFLRKISLKSSLIVPIVGIMMGAVVSAFTTFLALKFNLLQSLGVWFQGNFTSVMRGNYELLWLVIIATLAVFITADRLTVAGLGKDIATNVGLNYERVLLIGVGIISIVTGVTTVVIGALPFIGLIVPNMVTLVRGDHLRSNLPWVCLSGIWLLTVCDLVARTMIAPFEIPVSTLLSLIGAVVFIIFIIRGGRR